VGDRIAATLAGQPHREGLLRVAAGLVLTAPFTPMLFMGEEWGADTPWQFFTDHTDPFFAKAVSAGRKAEFAAHGWGEADIPDPQDKETFLRSKLDWTQPDREPYRSLHGWYRALLALRRARPELTNPRLDLVRVGYDEEARWLLVCRGSLRIAACLGSAPVEIPVAAGSATLLAVSAPDITADSGRISLPPASFAVIDTAQGA
jgi:maltooligosyltrehalose trehalohydrolase